MLEPENTNGSPWFIMTVGFLVVAPFHRWKGNIMRSAKIKTHIRRGSKITKRAVVGVNDAGEPIEISPAETVTHPSINAAKRASRALSVAAKEIVVEVTR